MPAPPNRRSETRADASRFGDPPPDDSGPTGTLRDSSARGGRRAGSDAGGPPQTGETFAGFTIGERVGRGAMGLVYRARDAAGRDVALKIILGHQADADGVARFVREGQAMAAIPSHPNVVRVLSAGKERGLPWLAMDFVQGETLKQRIKRGPLPVEQARVIAHRLAEALAHIHASGVVHRDLKPANVMLRSGDGEPLLTDFGLARIQGAQRLTLSGDVIGTPVYMSPEQVLGLKHEVDAQTDVWALGVVLYEMLAGAPPWMGANLTEMAQLITTVEPRPIRSVRGEVGRDLANAIDGALCKAKVHRTPDAAGFLAALDAVPERGSDSDIALVRSRSRTASYASGVSLPRARKQAIRVGLGLALLVGAATGVGLFVRSRMRGADVEALQGELRRLDDEAGKALPGLLGEATTGTEVAAFEARLKALATKRDAAAVPLNLSRVEDAVRRGRVALALAAKDWAAAEEHAAATASAEERTILSARVAIARGAAPDLPSLEALKTSKQGTLANAARVLLARVLLNRPQDLKAPPAAKALLAPVDRKLAAPELRRVDLLLAIDASDVEAVARTARETPKRALRSAWVRAFRTVEARLKPPAPHDPLGKSLHVLGALSPHADPKLEKESAQVAERVLERVQSLERELLHSLHRGDRRRTAAMSLVVDLVIALGRSGLRPPWPARGDLEGSQQLTVYRDLTNKLLYMQRDDIPPRRYALLLDAWVRLDIPLPGGTLVPTSDSKLSALPDGPIKPYLKVRRELYYSSRYGSAARKKMASLLTEEQRAAFGRHHQAYLLAQVALSSSQERKRAAQMAEAAARLDPFSDEVRYATAVTFARAGRPEARGAIERLERKGERLELRGKRALAFAYAYLGEKAQAEKWLTSIAATDERFADSRWVAVTKRDVERVLQNTLKKRD